ncbi:MAG: beta-ketoacyl-[acyl-carrier-protein] synthase II [Rickettsiales bacterium]|nr:beta-ketoacyl-[acyl-carrier-protein] synthase II [Rickettsiales bacterium]
MKNRVVVTGMGSLSPLGNSCEALWEALLAGRSGIGQISLFDTTDFPVTIAGEVRDFDPTRWIEPKEVKKLDRFLQFSIAAALMAVEDSGLEINDSNARDVGVYIGSGIGGADSLCKGSALVAEKGPRRISPFLIPRILINLASGHVSILLGAKGPNFSHVSACATGNHSIGEAMRLIQYGDAKVVISGGGEAGIIPVSVAGFAKMRALSPRNAEPTLASRPFDADRNGFVMSEGAGVVVLEELEYARARGARIYCEVKGYGANSDAHHMTAPSPDGSGATDCMQRALKDAQLSPEQIQYVNAHGTSTPFNDVAETQAIKRVFGEHAYKLAVSSTKSMTGHLLGAAGGLEAVICGMALSHGVLPPTINLDRPDPECDLDYIPHEPRELQVDNVLSNAFGFGGTNSCLVLGKVS